MRESISLHIETAGAGVPVVLMHGFAGSARNFRPQARALRDAFRVITFDARGHARSEAPEDPQSYRLECFLDDIDHVLDQMASGSVVLGGLSMGAGLALQYGLSRPDRLRGLVLAAHPPGEGGWARAFADAIEADGMDAAGTRFVWGGDRFDADAQKWIRQGFLEHPPHALVAILRQLLSAQPPVASLAESLRRLTVPALILVGERDEPSIAPSRDLAQLLPAAHLVEIPGAGHVVNLADPGAFNAALMDFLSSLEVSAAGEGDS